MTRGLLIDSNLLCLLTGSSIDPQIFGTHPRLNQFDAASVDLLRRVVVLLGPVHLCPEVLAETSNLLCFRQSSSRRARLLEALATVIAEGVERHAGARVVCDDPAYARLGFTDAALLGLVGNGILLTVDLPLVAEGARRGLRCVNFNFLRNGAIRPDQLS